MINYYTNIYVIRVPEGDSVQKNIKEIRAKFSPQNLFITTNPLILEAEQAPNRGGKKTKVD